MLGAVPYFENRAPKAVLVTRNDSPIIITPLFLVRIRFNCNTY